MIVVAGTGHRPPRLSPESYDDLRLAPMLRALCAEWLEPRVAVISYVIVGMAQGFDQALGWAAHDLGIPFDAYVPHKGQARSWPDEARAQYERLLALARKTLIVTEGPYVSWANIARDQKMVDDASDVVSLFDGIRNGGTYHTVQYAWRNHRTIHNLWQRFTEMRNP